MEDIKKKADWYFIVLRGIVVAIFVGMGWLLYSLLN
jgi:hypothetical protein